MGRYSVSGRSAATQATQDAPAAVLWNPSSGTALWVVEVTWSKTTATADRYQLIRSSTRGTPGSTVTPDIDNDRDRLLAPPSGAVLDLGQFTSTLPTVQGPALALTSLPGVAGCAFMFAFRPPIRVPPGTGLAIANPSAAAIVAADVTFVWDE